MADVLIEGTIVSAPAGGRVDVVLPSIEPDHVFKGCPYMPRGTEEPTPGAQCVVAVLDAETWVLVWKPA